MANRYSGFPAKFGYAGPSTLTLVQLGDYALDGGQKLEEIVPAGLVDRAAVILAMAEPKCRIKTQDLASVLAAVSPTVGLPCTSGLFQWQLRADSAVFASGSSHLKAVATSGFLYPETLSAAGERPAEMDLQFCPLWDGSNEPLAFTDGVATSGTPAFSSQYFLGPLYLDGSQVEGLLSTRINFGIQFTTFKGDGNVYPREGAITLRKPTISLTLSAVDYVPEQLSSLFNNSVSTTLAAYFAQGVPGGARYAYNTDNHVKVSLSTGASQGRTAQVTGESDATITIEIQITGTIGVAAATTIP